MGQVHQCKCAICQKTQPSPIKDLHAQINHFLGGLDDRNQRLYVGLEANKRGPRSEKELALIIGWSEADITLARSKFDGEVLGKTPAADDADMNAWKTKLASAKPVNPAPFTCTKSTGQA